MGRRYLLTLALSLALGCEIQRTPFHCGDHASCGEGGYCEAEGTCSFPDPACPMTARRHGELSPPDLARSCVETCATAVYAGGNTTCAARAGGSVVCWGANDSAQLGTGGGVIPAESAKPMVVSLANVGMTAVSIGGAHACVSGGSMGRIACWGDNRYGQVGLPRAQGDLIPVPTVVIEGTSACAGARHTCALRADGRVACWGDGALKQLGSPLSVASSDTPLTVETAEGPLEGVESIACGAEFTCARTFGAVFCWGSAPTGGSSSWVAGPVALPESHVFALVAGSHHACAVIGQGIYCWGDNQHGQLGRDPRSGAGAHWIPERIDTTLAVGGAITLIAGAHHTCARSEVGELICFGDNSSGQLGLGEETSMSWRPVLVPGLPRVESMAAGLAHTCALTPERRVYCFGDNARGQLGDGTAITRRSVGLPSGVTCPGQGPGFIR